MRWYRKAAEQNSDRAQDALGGCYAKGEGVAKDYVEAYKWMLLAAGQGDEAAKRATSLLEDAMTREQVAEGQKLARNFKPREVPASRGDSSPASIVHTGPESSGTGFFITEDGYPLCLGDAPQWRVHCGQLLFCRRTCDLFKT